MSRGCLVTALFQRMVIPKFTQDDGAHGGTFGGRILLPIETKALTADITVHVLPELRPFE
jgi:hypothetical protein